MAVTYVAQTVITGGAASSKNIARPSGATTGDLLVANVVVFPASATLTAPSTGSWMTLIAKTTVGSEFAFAIFARWDDGSSGPWAADTTGATSWADGECVAYRGLIGSGTVLDGTPSVSLDTFGFSTAALATAVTTTRANDLVLFYVLMGSTRSQSGTPSGYTDRLVPGTAANYLGDKVQASIATTGDATLNMASGTTNAAILMPLLTQAAGGGVPVYSSGVGITPTSAGVGTVLTVDNGVWTNTPLSYSYQWKRNTTNIGTNAATYTTVTADNGQPITCVVTATNASGSASRTSSNTVTPNAGTAPTNSVLPTITGSPASGAAITGHIGTWLNTPTTYDYEFRWLRDPTMIMPSNSGYQTIPGTAGTTSSSATAPTYVMGRNDASQSIIFHVTASNAAGSVAADSSSVIFYGGKIPFKSTGSPFVTTQASSSPVYNSAQTTIFQNAITNYRAAGTSWWNQGGNYGDNYSVYVHRVDSTMPRTPFLIVGGGTYGVHDLRNPPAGAVQNGDQQSHLAWTVGVKNGGIPTPPGGFRVVGPNTAASAKDAHCLVYVEDTFELFEIWNTYLISPGGSLGGVPYDTGYDNRYVGFWAGYMRDVRDNDGRWFGNKGFGTNGRYRLDRDGNLEYAGWGGTATSICLGATTLFEKELLVDASIGHAIGFVFPGHLSTFSYPASREASGEPGGTVGQGGWFTIDPALNLATLPTLGSAPKDAYRLKILTAIQTYGATNMDSTGNIISVKTEAMGGTWPNIPNVDDQAGLGMNEIFDSVPSANWKVLSPSWRPNGFVGNAKTATIVDAWSSLNFAAWNTGGTVSAASGQLTLTSTGGNVAIWPVNWASQSLVGSTLHTQTITMPAGATKNSFGIQPLNTEYPSPGLIFNIYGGNLRCEEYGWYANGTTDVGQKIGENVIAFNATNHKWIRFRMNSNHSVDWQTAPDNGSGSPGTWTTQRTSTPSLDLEDANIVYELTGPATTTAVWGVLNTNAVAGSAPVNTVVPAVTPGTIAAGGTLSTDNGTWSNSPTSYTYQWRRAGVNLTGATSASYVTVPADIGQAITCAVTAINAFGSAIAVSNGVTPSSGASPPANSVAPAVTPGIAAPGSVLSTTNGTWTNTPTGFTYQWKRGGTNISGATSALYTVVALDVGQLLTCVVTATNATGSASATSNSVTPTASTVTWVLGS